jgi:hypothetical protein
MTAHAHVLERKSEPKETARPFKLREGKPQKASQRHSRTYGSRRCRTKLVAPASCPWLGEPPDRTNAASTSQSRRPGFLERDDLHAPDLERSGRHHPGRPARLPLRAAYDHHPRSRPQHRASKWPPPQPRPEPTGSASSLPDRQRPHEPVLHLATRDSPTTFGCGVPPPPRRRPAMVAGKAQPEGSLGGILCTPSLPNRCPIFV